jgi:hypothetical protein
MDRDNQKAINLDDLDMIEEKDMTSEDYSDDE